MTRIFIGLENINPDNLLAAKKRQNKITEYRKMLLAWKAAGIWTYAGYILGFPNDTPESVRADLDILKRELPLDVLEFFFLTPLPGSEDHKTLWTNGVEMDPDLNRYDLEHACTAHPKMSKLDWEQLYRDAWKIYYTPEHIETILRRAQAYKINIFRLAQIVLWFSSSVAVEGVHPLQGGILRLINRHDRRSSLPIEPIWSFYPRLVYNFVTRHVRLGRHAWRIYRIYRKVASDLEGLAYTDQAIMPVSDDEVETLELFTHNLAARDAVDHVRKIKALTSVKDGVSTGSISSKQLRTAPNSRRRRPGLSDAPRDASRTHQLAASFIQRCDVSSWPEAAAHRVAAIRPQLEHKPTWHGLVNVRLQPRHALLVGSGRRSRSGAWRSSPPSERLYAIGSAAEGLNGRLFGHSALLLPLALRLADALPLMASARRVPGAACLRRYWRIVQAASFNCCRGKPLGTSPLSTQASIRLNRSSSCSSR